MADGDSSLRSLFVAVVHFLALGMLVSATYCPFGNENGEPTMIQNVKPCFLAALIISLIIFTKAAFGQSEGTTKSGPIALSETWDKTGSPYLVEDSVIVREGATLVIEAGVTVRFREARARIFVAGKLIVQGLATNPVVFVSDVPRRTDLLFTDREGITISNEARLEYATFHRSCPRIENAKRVRITGGHATDCRVGLYVAEGSRFPVGEITTHVESFEAFGNIDAGIRLVDANTRIVGSHIHDNRGVGVDVINTSEQRTMWITRALLANLLIHNNTGAGIHLRDHREIPWGGVLVNHSVVAANENGGIIVHQDANRNSGLLWLVVHNSILHKNSQFGVQNVANKASTHVSHVSVWNQANPHPNIDVIHPMTDDPLFADLSQQNYRLRIGSPLIDIGIASVDDVALNVLPDGQSLDGFSLDLTVDIVSDFDGGHRIVDGNGDEKTHADIGPYEFQPGENRAPIVQMVDVGLVHEGTPASFDASTSYDPDGAIVSWEWEFCDGTKANGRIVKHTFAFANDNACSTVMITVSDEDNITVNKMFAFRVNARPRFNTVLDEVLGYVGRPVQFDANASDPDGVIAKVRWEFSDGKMLEGVTVQRRFLTIRTATVLVTVQDNDGAEASATIPVTIMDGDFSPPSIKLESTYTKAPADVDLPVQAVVVDVKRSSLIRNGVDWVRLHYKPMGADEFSTIAMHAVEESPSLETSWSALIPKNIVGSEGVEYWIETKDKGVPNPNTSRLPETGTHQISILGPPEVISSTLDAPMRATQPINISAIVHPKGPLEEISWVSVFYRRSKNTSWNSLPMKLQQGTWIASIPSAFVRPPGIEYFINASEKWPIPFISQGGRWPKLGNFASVSVVDLDAPTMIHTPPLRGEEGSSVTLVADVTDNIAVASVIAYVQSSDKTFQRFTMTRQDEAQWTVTIPSTEVQAPILTYYLEAKDSAATPQVSTYPVGAPATLVRVDILGEDNTAPVIGNGSLPSSPTEGAPVTLAVTVTDDRGVGQVTLHYRSPNQSFHSVSMANTSGDNWTATIPGSDIQRPSLEYWIEAQDTAQSANIARAPTVAPTDVFRVSIQRVFDLSKGDLVVTEVMHSPGDSNNLSEWFEVYNPGSTPVDIDGIVVMDDNGQMFVVGDNQTMMIPPGSYFVFGQSDDENENGGIPVDYVYSDFGLDDEQDEIILVAGEVVVDRVAYDNSFPAIVGRTISLDSRYLDEDANNSPQRWCSASAIITDKEDYGTPAQENPFCKDADQEEPNISIALIPNNQPQGKPVKVSAVIRDASELKEIRLFYRTLDAESFEIVHMKLAGKDTWVATISGDKIVGSGIEYYISAKDKEENIALEPATAPKVGHSFKVSAADLAGPSIAIRSVVNEQTIDRPVTIEATVIDGAGVQFVDLNYQRVGKSGVTSIRMSPREPNSFVATIPARDIVLPSIEYYLEATDNNGNVTRAPQSGLLTLRISDPDHPTDGDRNNPSDVADPSGGCNASSLSTFPMWFALMMVLALRGRRRTTKRNERPCLGTGYRR